MRVLQLLTPTLSFLLVIAGTLQSQPPKNLTTYDTRENTGPVICSEGDLLQISFPFGIEPKEFIGNLRVEIQGKELKEIGVFRVPVTKDGKDMVFQRNISAFFKAEQAGRPVVKITQLDGKGLPRGEAREFKIVIRKPK